MKRKWLKTPNGKLVRCRPDKLKLFLRQSEALPVAKTTNIPTVDKVESKGRIRRSYSTEDFDPDQLAGLEVTVFGAGSVGGYCALYLAPARPTINIIDPKEVQARHTTGGRTIYSPFMVGRKKVKAAKQQIEHSCPGARVIPYPYDVREMPDIEINRILARSAVVIIAIDDAVQILRLSRLGYPIIELLQVGIQAQGRSGHIAISAPSTTPCLACTLNIDSPADIHRLDTEPANAWDIINVAQQAARIAVDIITTAQLKTKGICLSLCNTSAYHNM